MSKDNTIHECLPKIGFLFEEDTPSTIICKPKLMPLKTVTLEKVYFKYFILKKKDFYNIIKFS
jgi:hypothetical protein